MQAMIEPDTARVTWEESHLCKNHLYKTGLWGCLWRIVLIIDYIRGLSTTWVEVVPGPGLFRKVS